MLSKYVFDPYVVSLHCKIRWYLQNRNLFFSQQLSNYQNQLPNVLSILVILAHVDRMLDVTE